MSRSLLSVVVALMALATLTTTPTSAHAQQPPSEPPPTHQLKLTDFHTEGTACPRGTTAVALSPDNEVLSYITDDHAALVGPGIAPEKATSTCGIYATMQVPAGYAVAVHSARIGGDLDLQPGAIGRRTLRYGVDPAHLATFTSKPVTSATFDVYDFEHVADPPTFSPCGGPARITWDSTITVDAGTSTGASVMATEYHGCMMCHNRLYLMWKKCGS